MGQMEAQSVHLRALQAWRALTPAVQELWNSLAVVVPSHRPPFKKDHHITGHNLFVSAYHGFSQLGNEHILSPEKKLIRPGKIYLSGRFIYYRVTTDFRG